MTHYVLRWAHLGLARNPRYRHVIEAQRPYRRGARQGDLGRAGGPKRRTAPCLWFMSVTGSRLRRRKAEACP